MPNPCPKCGAPWLEEQSCRERFELCLAHEYEHPESYGAVHHLLVTGYMLQHNLYSRTAWIEARRMLAGFLSGELTPARQREQNHDRLGSDKRGWSITKGPRLVEFDSIRWTRTLADVPIDSPEAYCAGVHAWAESLLNDTRALENLHE